MAILLLRLAAPLQSWGDESKYNSRQTRLEPSKSGVLGLLAAALGLKRDSDEISSLSMALRMGIRVEMPGRIIMDYHIAHPPKYSDTGEVRYEENGRIMMDSDSYVTYRYYLSDACFLVGLESEDNSLLERLEEALRSPCYPLYLGRRACPPVLPLCLGIRTGTLQEVMEQEPWQASEWYRRRNGDARLRLMLETPKNKTAWYSLRDEPVSFSPIHRQYGPRGMEQERIVIKNDHVHDPMAELDLLDMAGDDEEHVLVTHSD